MLVVCNSAGNEEPVVVSHVSISAIVSASPAGCCAKMWEGSLQICNQL